VAGACDASYRGSRFPSHPRGGACTLDDGGRYRRYRSIVDALDWVDFGAFEGDDPLYRSFLPEEWAQALAVGCDDAATADVRNAAGVENGTGRNHRAARRNGGGPVDRGKRVPVVVTIDGSYQYRNTISSMGGRLLLSFNAETRKATGRAAGAEVEVRLDVDDVPRVVEVPAELAEAFRTEPAAAAAWAKLSFSHQREHAEAIASAKTSGVTQSCAFRCRRLVGQTGATTTRPDACAASASRWS
jgi:hypothetical protein